jgi:predicted phage terminase large subunit-like protein
MLLTPEVIEGFQGSILRNRFDNPSPVPDFHREIWGLMCLDNRYVAVAAPRGHAKSTAVTHTYGLAAALFRQASFIVLVSDTETQSVQFLNDIKMELNDNSDLQALFGVSKFIKYTENDIIVEMDDRYQFRILAKGSEQSLRGLKWSGMRPKLIICDDMENDELVMNKDRREKFFRWIYGALIPCLAPDGKMRVVGTVLHMDSFLEHLMPKDWDKYTRRIPLKVWSERPKMMWTSVKYRAHDEEFEHVLWKERFPADKLKILRQEYYERGIPDVYSQEYLNYPLDPTKAYFKRTDFIPITQQDYNQIDDYSKPMSHYIGVDLAISEKERADYSVFVVCGIDSEGVLYILDVIRDRIDGREIIDTLFSLEKRYKPEFISIEKEKISKAIGPFLYEEMPKRGLYPNIIEITPSKDLLTRARSVQGRMRAGYVKFNKKAEWYPTFEAEMTTFPRSSHDDQVAAMAVLGLALDKMVEAPTSKELMDEEWEFDFKSSIMSGAISDGRSATTGY